MNMKRILLSVLVAALTYGGGKPILRLLTESTPMW